MMSTVLLALGIFILAFLGMAVGVIFSNRCIKGSCGGLGNIEGADNCSACGGCSVSDQKNQSDAVVSNSSCSVENDS